MALGNSLAWQVKFNFLSDLLEHLESICTWWECCMQCEGYCLFNISAKWMGSPVCLWQESTGSVFAGWLIFGHKSKNLVIIEHLSIRPRQRQFSHNGHFSHFYTRQLTNKKYIDTLEIIVSGSPHTLLVMCSSSCRQRAVAPATSIVFNVNTAGVPPRFGEGGCQWAQVFPAAFKVDGSSFSNYSEETNAGNNRSWWYFIWVLWMTHIFTSWEQIN